MKRILPILFTTVCLLFFSCKTLPNKNNGVKNQENKVSRVEIKKWFHKNSVDTIRTTGFDHLGQKLYSIDHINGVIRFAYIYTYSEGSIGAYELDGTPAWISTSKNGVDETVYYYGGIATTRTTYKKIGENKFRFITYSVPEQKVLEAWDDIKLENGETLQITLHLQTFDELRQKILPSSSDKDNYEMEYFYDDKNREIKSIAKKNGETIFETQIIYHE